MEGALRGRIYTPQQIIRAYEVYAKGYRNRNGSDASMAKNLASWLKREGGLVDIADDPERCIATNEDGSPLSMEDLADRFKRFGRMWRKAKARRGLVLSNLQAGQEFEASHLMTQKRP